MKQRIPVWVSAWGAASALCLLSSTAWACNPKCPTCQVAQAQVQHNLTMVNLISKPVIGPNYVCHDPNWTSQDASVGRWSSLIKQISSQTDNGYMPPIFTAAEMYNESGGNPDAIGSPVPNRALGLMQTLPPSEEQDAESWGDIHGYNGNMATAWPRLPNHSTPLPSPQHSIRMGIQEQINCVRFVGYGLDPAAIPACYSHSIEAGREIAAAHNDYQAVLAGHPGTLAYVTKFLNFAHCTPIAPTASTPYRKYP